MAPYFLHKCNICGYAGPVKSYPHLEWLIACDECYRDVVEPNLDDRGCLEEG